MQLPRRFYAALTLFLFAALTMVSGHGALAQTPKQWVPKPWEIGMQPAGNSLKARIIDLHDLVLVIITLITLFVGVLLLWVMWRYSAKRNPIPSRTSHHTLLEVAWTVVPVLILVVIAIPSFRLVYYLDHTPDPDMTIKVTAHQWYWEYGYPDQGDLAIESRLIRDEDLKPGQIRLLSVDNQLVLPVGKKIRILTTSADVIHSFFIPSLGVQRYAIPGRTIETWVSVDKPGVYYGQCNQICGVDHSRMPIAVHAVTDDEFKAWVAQAKKSADATPATGATRQVMAAADDVAQPGVQR
ncbi:MAG: cytochrome c oxidase subunit II [Acetobacteraceae bacterium]